MNPYDLMERCLKDPNEIERLALHADWRVRYAAAVAIGRTQDPRWLPQLKLMLRMEDARPLYSQPPVQYINSTDDTRMAEQIGPIEVVFDQEYDEATKEAWRCRGRVKQAALFALHDIGQADDELREMVHAYLEDPDEDYSVKAAAARAVGTIGDSRSLPALQTVRQLDEWCTQTEADKAARRISNGANA